jgi:aspartyl-tRNA(Asn)/glutamyl-tRNA(Gln) amidotransferase subunit C
MKERMIFVEIQKEEIIHIANLSNLNLSDAEVSKYTEDMKQIVEFANKVNEVDTSSVKETAFITDSVNVFRKDEVMKSMDRKELLQNAPSSNGEAYSIPHVL